MKRLICIGFACWALVGCATTYVDGPYEITKGKRFNYSAISSIKNNETSLQEVFSKVGDPIESDNNTYKYWFVECRTSITKNIWFDKKSVQCAERELILKAVDSMVIENNYTIDTYNK